MTDAPPEVPPELAQLIDSVGLEPLAPLFEMLDAELAAMISAPPADPKPLAAKAHGLVGGAGGMGFETLAQLSRKLELACAGGGDWGAELAAVRAEAATTRRVISGVLARRGV